MFRRTRRGKPAPYLTERGQMLAGLLTALAAILFACLEAKGL